MLSYFTEYTNAELSYCLFLNKKSSRYVVITAAVIRLQSELIDFISDSRFNIIWIQGRRVKVLQVVD